MGFPRGTSCLPGTGDGRNRVKSGVYHRSELPCPESRIRVLRAETVQWKRHREIGPATALQLRTSEPHKWSQTGSPPRSTRKEASASRHPHLRKSLVRNRYWKVSGVPDTSSPPGYYRLIGNNLRLIRLHPTHCPGVVLPRSFSFRPQPANSSCD